MKVNFNVDEDDDDDDDDDDDGDDDGDDDQDKVSTQKPAPWNLARLSHRLHLHLNHTHSYVYPTHAGDSIVAYVVDTGVNIRHAEFDGRAKWGVTVPEGDEDVDGNGHGTHVAGTIAGKTFGVAKNAGVVAVKVLRSNGSGSMSDVVRGIQWVVEHHVNRTKEAEDLTKRDGHARKVKSVGNMSLGGGMSRILNLAVNRAFDNGVLFAVAAGNDNRDACDYSPASAEKPITVGATTIQDTRAWFSNYGKCMDIFAPGHLIESAWIGSENATNTISGTSMATPHVAGLIADFWSRSEYQKYSPKEMKKLVLHVGTKGAVSGIPKQTATKNLLAFSLPPKRIE
ncbi:peptidase S8/S53 domain-containing protein [Gaertneriomyces semiglobifer]|nr:peptidase S8/S53 domain-containing protein [Gaertneriomyces semiglobifer]